MGQNTKNGASQGPDLLNINGIEMIAHIGPGPNTAYLEQGFSTVDPGPDIRFQWILTWVLAINWQKVFFFSSSCAKQVNALGFNSSVGLAG